MGKEILHLLGSILAHYGYAAVAVILLLENLGLPLPGESVLLLAGFLAASQQRFTLASIIAVGVLATTTGSLLGYLAGHHGGRPFLRTLPTEPALKRCHAAERREAICSVRSGRHCPRAFRGWPANFRRANRGRAPHALGIILVFQLSRLSSLGKRGFMRGIFFRPTLEQTPSPHGPIESSFRRRGYRVALAVLVAGDQG